MATDSVSADALADNSVDSAAIITNTIVGGDLSGTIDIVTTGYMNTPDIDEFRTFVFIVDDGDGFIMKLDADGNTIWEKEIDDEAMVNEFGDGWCLLCCGLR